MPKDGVWNRSAGRACNRLERARLNTTPLITSGNGGEMFAAVAYPCIYLVVLFSIPERRLCRGLFTRHVIKKVIRVPYIWEIPVVGNTVRYFGWLILMDFGLQTLCGWSSTTTIAIFYTTYVVILLDDYFFGDDDRRKRMKEWAKNKVKWLWTPPAKLETETG